MATIDELTLDIEEMIYGQTPTTRPDTDQLATAVTSNSDTSWRFDLAGKQFWSRGDYAEYVPANGSVGEIVQFMADHATAGADVTVARAQRQTTAAASYSIGDLFRKNSPLSRIHIQRVINEVIDNDLQNGLWYRNARSITYNTGRNRYPVNAADYYIERMYQIDTQAEAIGDFGYDETGGAAEDLWTISSGTHGLAVGDMVRFSAAGDNATGYAVGIIYFVASVESTTAVTLSATSGGSAIAGTGDSTSDWTLERLTAFNYHEFDTHDYEWVAEVSTAHESTGRAVIVKRVVSSDDPIYYVARTRLKSADIASFPTEILNLIPWGVVARLTGGTSVRRRLDPNAQQGTIEYADSEFFRSRFERMVDDVRKRLRKELRALPDFKYGPINYG